MAATLAARASVPFHLGLTEPIDVDETTITGYPAVEGAYDPVEQIWRLPDGTLLTDSKASGLPLVAALTLSHIWGMLVGDDVT
ncbi:MAG: hypothetical protein ABSB76_16800 [Streptosporangiaceae bacterium]|jgi:hypothetical protein